MEKPRNYESPETIRPITPEEINEMKLDAMPNVVLEIVNQLIVENIRQGHATIKQRDIVRELVACGFDQQEIFDRGWLNFEDIYRETGWEVAYDKPGWDESYDAYFTFTIPKNRKLGSVACNSAPDEDS